jgi:hypothetical protein
MLLDELLQAIPSDTEERVRRTRERLNQNIRRILREETALRFRHPPSGRQDKLFPEDSDDSSSLERGSVRIQLVPGLPKCLRGKQIDDAKRIAALIAPWRDSLEKLRDSAKATLELTGTLARDPAGKALVERGPEHLPGAIELAERLLNEAKKFDLAKWILEVDQDVLGAYCYHVQDDKDIFYLRRRDSWIELYWGVIGLVSRVLAVEIEDLTTVVLAHELAHAYTHVGTDIDGHAWSSLEFANTEHGLREGLAQFYGLVTCRRLAVSVPKAKDAFDKLLVKQPPAYHSHESWLSDLDPEQIRLSVLQTRRSGAGTLKDFNERLKSAKGVLRKARRPS